MYGSMMFNQSNGNEKNFSDVLLYQGYHNKNIGRILLQVDVVSMWVQLISIVLSITSNGAVLFVSTKSRVLTLNKFVINFLSVSDLVYSIFQILMVHRRFNNHTWEFGQVLCKLSVMSPCAIITSIFLITFIAFERHRTILYPFRPKLKKQKIFVLVGVLWVSASVIMFPTFLHMRVVQANGKNDCALLWKSSFSKYWNLVVFLTSYPLPLAVITVCYLRILFQVTGRLENSSLLLNKNTPVSFRANKTKETIQHRKMMVMLAAIVIAFILTTTPNQVKMLWLAFFTEEKEDSQITFLVLFTLSTLVHLHSFINPIIYCVSDPKFRKLLFRKKSNSYSSKFSATFRMRKDTTFISIENTDVSSLPSKETGKETAKQACKQIINNNCKQNRNSLFTLSNLSDSREIFSKSSSVKSTNRWYRNKFFRPIILWFDFKRSRIDTSATEIFFLHEKEEEAEMRHSITATSFLMQSSM